MNYLVSTTFSGPEISENFIKHHFMKLIFPDYLKRVNYSFKAEIQELTILGRQFYITLDGLLSFTDADMFLKKGMMAQENRHTLIWQNLEKVYDKYLGDYFWVFENSILGGQLFPSLYKFVRSQDSIEKVNKWERLPKAINGPENKQGWYEIEYLLFNVCPDNRWAKENESMITREERQRILKKYNYLEIVENYNIAVQSEINRRVQRQAFTSNLVDIEAITVKDGLHLIWKVKQNGTLKIFRKEGSFSQDKFDEASNGILVVDDYHANGETMDYSLEKGMDYFYTVNIHQNKMEGGVTVHNIARFNVRLPFPEQISAEQAREKELDLKAKKLEESLNFKLIETLSRMRHEINRKLLSKQEICRVFSPWESEILKGDKPDDLSGQRLEDWEDLQDLKKDFLGDV